MSILGLTIRKLREEANLSIEDLAKELSVSKNLIRNIENGYLNADADFTEKAAAFFGVTPEYLRASIAGFEPAFLPKGYCCVNIFESKAIETGVLCESDVIDRIVIQTSDEHEDYIAMLVKNNLLSNCRIYAGDTVVIARRSIAENGDVCLISFPDQSVDLRKFYRDGTKVTLFTDSKEEDLPSLTYDISNSSYKVLGKVVKLIANM